MSDQIDDVVKKTRRYLYEDGLIEIAIGLLFLFVGLGLLAWLAVRDASTYSGAILIVGLFVVAVVGGLYTKKAIERMKQRITYPRTGYVAYKQAEPDRGRWLVIVLALTMAILVVFLPEELAQMSTVVGASLCVILLSLGYRLMLRRFYPLGLVALLAGLSASVLFENEARGVAATLVVAGGALLVSGSYTLFVYVRRHPQIDEVGS
jgi:hypothetical protein